MSFFWYKDEIVNLYLRAKFNNWAISHHDFGNNRYQLLHKINQCFSNLPWGLLHDTTNHVPHHFNIRTKTPYQYQSSSLTFESICLETANQIAKSTDRQLAVMWSGGIDSTSALVALMKTVELNRITVICTEHSINEFPTFFQEKILNKVEVISPETWSRNFKDFFAVSGDGGDTMWGTLDQSFYTRYKDSWHKPWQDCISREIITDMDFVEEFSTWSGTSVKSWLELRIWFYLSCKWQDKCAKIFYLNHDLTDKDGVAFYDVNDKFKIWTMNNLDQIVGKTWEEYKVPAKKFIYQYHADRDYLIYKSKFDSVQINVKLRNTKTWRKWMRIALSETYEPIQLSSWPFIDYQEFETMNNIWKLIPLETLVNDQ